VLAKLAMLKITDLMVWLKMMSFSDWLETTHYLAKQEMTR